MTPSVLLLLWLGNWLVTSALVIFYVKNPPSTPQGYQPDLWDLEKNLPSLVTLLLAAWPAALVRLMPAILPVPTRRGRSGQRG
ncbi:hypothetical protein ABT039_22245 [Streptomyces lasiicapitis]|uniref:hypothetical protein n=1 Tax=Streptomyces lasiicapitis TaxID=1923961 RepID=UPI00332D2819